MAHDQGSDQNTNRVAKLHVTKANFAKREADGQHHKDEQNRILLKKKYDVYIHVVALKS